MKKCSFIVVLILIYSCGTDYEKINRTDYDKISIEIRQYPTKFRRESTILNFEVNDKFVIQKLNELKKNYKRKLLRSKGTEYLINIKYSEVKSNKSFTVRILKNEEFDPVIQFGYANIFQKVYENKELTDYVFSLLKLDAVNKYPGPMNQNIYDSILILPD